MSRKVSVIIPCYNRESIVGETIENMLHQTYAPYEVIVVNDGSTDNSEKVIRSFGARVTLITQLNQGPGAARNNGFKASSGDFIQFMDSDDLASRNKIEIQLSALEKANADFAYCPWVRCQIKEHQIRFLDRILQVKEIPTEKSMLEWFLSGWSLVFQNCLFKRSLISSTGGYRTDLLPSEDMEYLVRILLSGAKAVHTPGCVVFYREDNADKISSTGTSSLRRAKDWTQFLDISGKLLNGQIQKMKFSTKLALATNVKNHIDFCKKNGLGLLPNGHPYTTIDIPFKSLLLFSYGYYQRVQRKFAGSADYNKAFQPALPSALYSDMINEIGYTHRPEKF